MDYEFNLLGLESNEQKHQMAWTMLKRTVDRAGLPELPVEEFCNFITITKHKYNKKENPFHNYVHALTVEHGCFMFSVDPKLSTLLPAVMKFSLVLSGLLHDMDHPATTNIFQINAQTKLAIRYSDRQVLENHHICEAFRVLSTEETNILKAFSS